MEKKEKAKLVVIGTLTLTYMVFVILLNGGCAGTTAYPIYYDENKDASVDSIKSPDVYEVDPTWKSSDKPTQDCHDFYGWYKCKLLDDPPSIYFQEKLLLVEEFFQSETFKYENCGYTFVGEPDKCRLTVHARCLEGSEPCQSYTDFTTVYNFDTFNGYGTMTVKRMSRYGVLSKRFKFKCIFDKELD